MPKLGNSFADFLKKEHFVAGNPDLPLTFGCEIELSLEYNPRLVEQYKPIPFDEDQWTDLEPSERISKATGFNIWAQKSNQYALTFEKMEGAACQLPAGLYTEGTGMLEQKGSVSWCIDSIQKEFHLFEEHFGPCQVQGHVAFPRQAVPGFAGYSVFASDYAMLTVLAEEYASYLKTGRKPAGNFISPFVPPPDDTSQADFLKTEELLASHEPFVMRLKFVSAPVLRGPDVYGQLDISTRAATTKRDSNSECATEFESERETADCVLADRIGIEVREWDTPSVGEPPLPGRADRVVQSMALIASILEKDGDFSAFKPFQNTTLSNEFSFKNILEDLTCADALAVLQQNNCLEIALQVQKINPQMWNDYLFTQLEAALLERNKTFRVSCRHLFCYPLRPWRAHPVFEKSSCEKKAEYTRQIWTAQAYYLADLCDLQNECVEKGAAFSDGQLLAKARVAVARWASQLSLGSAFEVWMGAYQDPF